MTPTQTLAAALSADPTDHGPIAVPSDAVRGVLELTGQDLFDHLVTRHEVTKRCPGCDEDVMTVGINQLAYTFQTCDCGVVDYGHLVERIWHTRCLDTAAPDLAAAEMLDTAAHWLEQYKRGRPTADRIRAFLAAIPDGGA